MGFHPKVLAQEPSRSGLPLPLGAPNVPVRQQVGPRADICDIDHWLFIGQSVPDCRGIVGSSAEQFGNKFQTQPVPVPGPPIEPATTTTTKNDS